MLEFPEELAHCMGFQWDDSNATKNWEAHQVSPAEAEQLFFNCPIEEQQFGATHDVTGFFDWGQAA